MTRYGLIENILIFISGATGINFQLKLKEIFGVYYKSIGKTFEMPSHYGGDQKNDGWVVEDGLFYQIFAPTRPKSKDSFKKEIEDKFKDDLTGLLKIIYEEKKWGGVLNEFIFIVNTFDGSLPHDSNRFFETLVNELKKEYDCEFKHQVKNVDYIKDILYSINDIEILEEISSRLHMINMVNHNAITEIIMTDLIIDIANNCSKKISNSITKDSYDRISSIKKIKINDLIEKKDEIENIISNLDTVEKAINIINQDILNEDKFESVKLYVIDIYNELSLEYRGVELYNQMIKKCRECTNKRWDLEVPIKFLIVFIFDKCDIFEKE